MNELPILYYKGKGGALYQWRAWVEGNTILTEYGQVGGQMQRTPGKVCVGKNTGKKNATTDEEQALAELQSMQDFKLKRTYRASPEEASETRYQPMKAHPIEKVKKLDPRGDVQPKLDGLRCMAFWEGDSIRLLSKSGLPYDKLPHVTDALREVLPRDGTFDGELYAHGIHCSKIVSYVKRPQPESLLIGYHVYDVPQMGEDDSLPWSERRKLLERYVPADHPGIVRVPSFPVTSMEEIQAYQLKFVGDRYEGGMFRHQDGLYEFGHRSNLLLKVKTFEDAEFVVVGGRSGDGKMADAIIWRCRNDRNDAEFDVDMCCPMEERESYLRDLSQYVGRKLTVKFMGRTGTDKDLPRFPKGKLFRPVEDLASPEAE